MFSKIMGKKSTPESKEEVVAEVVATEVAEPPAVVHKMQNGLIQDKPVEYTLGHTFDGNVLRLTLNAGPGHTAVTAYPTPHEPAAVAMKNEGDVWIADLKNFKEGEKIEVHFVIENNGHQADNSDARHVIVIPASANPSAQFTIAAEADPKHKMPNGLIKGNQVEYTLAHTFDGSTLTLTLNAGPGHSAVTVHPVPHDPAAVEMRNEGDLWIADLKGFKEGEDVEFHFVIQNNGEQVDNSTAKHKVVVPAAAAAAGSSAP